MSTRLTFPADRTAYVFTALGQPLLVPDQSPLQIFLEETCDTLADIRTPQGAQILNSTVYTDASGLIPEFLGPLSVTRLWAKPLNGVGYPLDANYGNRIDNIEQALGEEVNPLGGVMLSGHGAPGALLGQEMDFYLDLDSHGLYGPKSAAGWGSPTSLVGPSGSTRLLFYTYVQDAATEVWNIEHPLTFIPGVTVTDSAGTQVFGDVQILGPNQIQINFSAPFSGSAFLS